VKEAFGPGRKVSQEEKGKGVDEAWKANEVTAARQTGLVGGERYTATLNLSRGHGERVTYQQNGAGDANRQPPLRNRGRSSNPHPDHSILFKYI